MSGIISTPESDKLTELLNIINDALTVTAAAPIVAITVLNLFPTGFSGVSRAIYLTISPQTSIVAAVPRLMVVEN